MMFLNLISDEATLPALVRARMVTIKGEDSNNPSYEQVDDISPTKLLRKMQPSLDHSYYETARPIANTDVSYMSSTINNHQPSDYNRLVYSKSEEDFIGQCCVILHSYCI